MRFVYYFVLIFFLINTGKLGLAADVTALERTKLSNLIVDINEAVRGENFAVIASHMPARLYKEMAHRLGVTEASLRSDFLKKLRAQFKTILAGTYHLDEANVEYFQTRAGTFYAFIPTQFETKDSIVQYKTLAIVDNSQWYLIYGGKKTVQNPVFLEIYNDLGEVNLTKETVIKKRVSN
nr:hypothetical protein [Bartonella ancashensis]